jgi:hypothetical protein
MKPLLQRLTTTASRLLTATLFVSYTCSEDVVYPMPEYEDEWYESVDVTLCEEIPWYKYFFFCFKPDFKVFGSSLLISRMFDEF